MTRRNGFGWVDFVKLVALAAVPFALVMAVLAGFRNRRENELRSSCQSNLKQLTWAFKAYTEDYDDKLPFARGDNGPGVGYGWVGAMEPYGWPLGILQCRANPTFVNLESVGPNFNDYWFNANLSGIDSAKLKHDANTFLFGDGAGGGAAYSLNRPEAGPNYAWMNRHLGGANYAFADGHVKWLMPTVPITDAVSGSVFTFGT